MNFQKAKFSSALTLLYTSVSFRFEDLGMQDRYVAMQKKWQLLPYDTSSDMSRIDTCLQ